MGEAIARQRSSDEKAKKEPYGGIQGEGGAGHSAVVGACPERYGDLSVRIEPVIGTLAMNQAVASMRK